MNKTKAVQKKKWYSLGMSKRKVFNTFISALEKSFTRLPDYRRGANTQYEIKDAAVAAFSIFFTQSPSFLASQRLLKNTKGKSNLGKLFGVENIPSDRQIKNLLDSISPDFLYPLFWEAHKLSEEQSILKKYKSYAGQILISNDGTATISSEKLHCQNCSHRKLRSGKTQYYHSVLLPVIVKAGMSKVLALAPEFIAPEDGQEKQDCERAEPNVG